MRLQTVFDHDNRPLARPVVNPTDLPILFDFPYHQEIGAFTDAHPAALDAYIAEMDVTEMLDASHI